MGSIHIKLEYPQAISIKRDMLLIEKNFLEALKYIKNYNNLRKKEFIIKNKLKKDLEILGKHLLAIENDLPREEAVDIMKKIPKTGSFKNLTRKIKEKPRTLETKKSSIEMQIDEIREKLARLGQQTEY
jgi:hypothetical protein